MTKLRRPAILGGKPAFGEPIPFARPHTPSLERVMERLRPSFDRGMLTNGPLVRELEEAAATRLGTAEAVAVASCTHGLLLCIQAVAQGQSAILPSFTFSATAHAAAWNGMTPVFTECDPATFQIDVAAASRDLAHAEDPGVILATQVFGAPCDVEAVEALGRDTGLPIVFDAAHAFGARRRGRPVGGFGQAEVFSLSPTKPVVAGEGGIVATNDADLAARLRLGRDYGNPGDYDSRFVGLNARMSELHAALALESLADLDENLARRRDLATRYRAPLAEVPGIRVQHVDPEDTSTFKDLTIAVSSGGFGMDRDALVRALSAEGIDTRNYFSPPVHRHQAYADLPTKDLPVTDAVAAEVVSLPLFTALPDHAVDTIVEIIAALHHVAAEVAEVTAPE